MKSSFPMAVVLMSAAMISATFVFADPASAQDADPALAPSLDVELNGAADMPGGACRLTYVAVNRTGTPLGRVSYELAVFDAGGQVTQLLAFDIGALPDDRTKVLQFDLADTPCADLSRILVNDAIACETDDGAESAICLDALAAASRTDIRFGL